MQKPYNNQSQNKSITNQTKDTKNYPQIILQKKIPQRLHLFVLVSIENNPSHSNWELVR